MYCIWVKFAIKQIKGILYEFHWSKSTYISDWMLPEQKCNMLLLETTGVTFTYKLEREYVKLDMCESRGTVTKDSHEISIPDIYVFMLKHQCCITHDSQIWSSQYAGQATCICHNSFSCNHGSLIVKSLSIFFSKDILLNILSEGYRIDVKYYQNTVYSHQ